MSGPEIIDAIKPGLTLYGVLVTIAFFCFTLGRFFWNFEKGLRQENIERVKNLMHSFRRTHIEPILAQQLCNASGDAYSVALANLRDAIYPDPEGHPMSETKRRFESQEIIKSLLSQDSLKARTRELEKPTKKEVEKFLASGTGNEIFDNLDHAYERRSELSDRYRGACVASLRAAYAFFYTAPH